MLYDIQGNLVQTPLYGRLVALSEDQIRSIKNRICVASGKSGYKIFPCNLRLQIFFLCRGTILAIESTGNFD